MSIKKWSQIRNTALALACAAGLASANIATVGGNVQIVNLLNSSAQAGLDLTSAGTGIEIANFTISNNTSQFTLAFTFTNGGEFVNVAHAAQVVPMTKIVLFPNGGTSGTGIAVVDPTTDENLASFTTGGDITTRAATHVGPTTVTWTPAAQSTPTVGYIFSMRGDWAAATSVLAGLYTETVTATLTAIL